MSQPTTVPNVAIWVNADGTRSIQQLSSDLLSPPEGASTLVSVAFSGINPADVKHARILGIVDTVAGYDFSGTVISAGPDSKYRVGDTIAGVTPSGVGRDPRHGTHQNYLLVPDAMTFPVPANLPLDHAACLAVSARTAADALFNNLGYPLPTDEPQAASADAMTTPPPLPALLVWGGASSLGFMAIQYAKAIGVRTIFATASPENHAALEQLGATRCFDYRNPDVVAKIRAAAAERGGPLERIFDAIGSLEQETADTAASCGAADAVVTTAGPHAEFQITFAVPDMEFKIQLQGQGEVITNPAQPAKGAKVIKALEWAVRNYGTRIRIPKVEVFGDGTASEALEYLDTKAEQGAKFRKVCLKHPLKV